MRKISCTTRCSSLASAARDSLRFGSDIAGFSPMIYMPDCLRAFQEIMNAQVENLKHRTSYNLSALSFSPAELAVEIQKHRSEFTITYKPDYRQEIADSWPKSIDDSCAREEWGWSHDYGLETMVEDMCLKLSARHEKGEL